jgi:hypothetical protein
VFVNEFTADRSATRVFISMIAFINSSHLDGGENIEYSRELLNRIMMVPTPVSLEFLFLIMAILSVNSNQFPLCSNWDQRINNQYVQN